MTAVPPPNDFDGPWKEALDTYPPEILAFLFPEVHAGIDWKRQYEPLDRELQQVAPGDAAGQAVDKLVRVYRQDGQEAWVLVHIEVQSQPDRHFAARMFRYHAASTTVSVARSPDWRSWATIARTGGPHGSVTPSGTARSNPASPRSNSSTTISLYLRAARTPARQSSSRVASTRRATAARRSSGAIWLLRLPEALEATTWQQIQAFEEEQQMAYSATAERIGHSQGCTDGVREAITMTLTSRFGASNEPLLLPLQQITEPDTLHALFERILGIATLDEARGSAAQ